MSKLITAYKSLQKKKATLIGQIKGKQFTVKTAFRINDFSDRGSFTISNASDSQVFRAMAQVLNYEAAQKELGRDSKTLSGYTLEEWKEDLKLRDLILRRNETLIKMEEAEGKLMGIMTAKELRTLKADAILDEIDNL